ncbi:MAG TPA: nucleotidyltransferase family protein [Methanospirillum sp.]|nr:nucleotidyltransferase family protein [Methanospirillum sp.]
MKRVDSIADIRKTIGLHRVTLNNQYHIRRIGIFGSAARDELSDSSDVDILVEFETTVGYFLLSHLHDELCKILGRNVDLATPGAIHPVLHDSIMQDLIYV